MLGTEPIAVSGTGSGELKPTIIGGECNQVKPTVFKPTIIVAQNIGRSTESQDPPHDRLKPTVIGSGNAPLKGPVRPTIIPSGPAPEKCSVPEVKKEQPTRTPTVMPSASPPKAIPENERKPMTVTKSTTIPGGVVRKGLEVGVEDLKKQFPANSVETLTAVRDILIKTVLETLTMKISVGWGTKDQERYGKLVKESLALTGSERIRDSQRHLGRLYALLLEVATSFRNQDNSGLAFWKKWESPLEAFREREAEIDQLSTFLRAVLPDIIDIQAKIDDGAREYVSLSATLEAQSLAAHYLSNLLTNKTPEQESLSQRLLERSLSLTQTVAQIKQGDIGRQSMVREIGELISRIQDGVLLKLPAWIEQVGIVQAKDLTKTEVYTVQRGLEDVVNQLKSK